MLLLEAKKKKKKQWLVCSLVSAACLPPENLGLLSNILYGFYLKAYITIITCYYHLFYWCGPRPFNWALWGMLKHQLLWCAGSSAEVSKVLCAGMLLLVGSIRLTCWSGNPGLHNHFPFSRGNRWLWVSVSEILIIPSETKNKCRRFNAKKEKKKNVYYIYPLYSTNLRFLTSLSLSLFLVASTRKTSPFPIWDPLSSSSSM